METATITKISKGKISIFVGLFGVSLAAFAAGFDNCLLDIDKADECVAHAQGWVDKFKAVGDHIIAWILAIFTATFK